MPSDLEICNTALELIGANPISSFDDSTREARICDQIYTITKQNLLQSHKWNFSLAYTELNKTVLATTSSEYEFGYENEYTLPTDFLRLIKKDGLTNDYRLVGDKVYTNDSEVHVLYQYDVTEGEFPAYFTRSLELKMAELLSAAILQDDTQIQIWNRLYTQQVKLARSVDSQNSPPVQIEENNFALTDVR